MLPSSLVPITRTVMRQRYRTVSSRFNDVPKPDDAAHGAVDAPIGHRVLVLGNEYAVSWGVRTHALALPGQLARELAIRTGLGADVDVVAQPGMSITDVLSSLPSQDVGSYDAILVLAGVGDAFQLLSPLRWRMHVQELTDALTTSTASATQITIVGIQPVSSVNITQTKKDGVVDRWAEALNEMTESVLSATPRVSYLPAPHIDMGMLEVVDRLRFKSPTVYKEWARALARHIAPRLSEPFTASAPNGTSTQVRTQAAAVAPSDSAAAEAVNPLGVRQRLDALHDLDILYTSPEARFNAIVRRARDLFGTEAAVFSLLTDKHQWNKAMLGYSRTELPLEESFCATTIKADGPFVVEDAWSDPRIPFNTFVRFYAGYPVTAPDGTRIGALCIFDGNPRDASTIDTDFLKELAQNITNQLALPKSAPAPSAA